MIPGELFLADEDIVLNSDRLAVDIVVSNTGDRPIQVGSHYPRGCMGQPRATNCDWPIQSL
ncbi:MAG: hypothetical protein EBX04_07745 [Rhodobacteraceae bacterium]|nr:hypothetical protein [Paracoccaceae bacterium]